MSEINPILLGTITSILGGVLVLAVQYLWRWQEENKSQLTGEWENRILDGNGDAIKIDKMDVRQRGSYLNGAIRRIQPEESDYRKWLFKGYKRGESIIAIFWSEDETVKSYGAWHVRHVADGVYEGYYLSLSDSSDVEAIKLRFVKPPT